jgi:hypothetical protein
VTATERTLPDGRVALRCARCGAERLVENADDVAEDRAFFDYEHRECVPVTRGGMRR